MTTNLEEHLMAGMRQEMRGVALAGDVLGRAGRRYRRREAAIRLAYGLGVIGVVGALVAGVTLSGGAPEKAPAVAAPDSPALRLANAATASDGVSYRLRLTGQAWAIDDGKRSGDGTPIITEGAFDPSTATGYARTPNEWGVYNELLINGTRYGGTEPRTGGKALSPDHEEFSLYGQYPGTYERLDWGLHGVPVLAATAAEPAALLKALKDANATITENPDGTLRFRFTSEVTKGRSVYNGDVTLDADGRIAKIALTGEWESTVKGRLDQGEFVITIELSDYGLPVTVERPARVVPHK